MYLVHGKNRKYWDRKSWANSVDPDQVLQNAASDLGLHCLPLIQYFLDPDSSKLARLAPRPWCHVLSLLTISLFKFIYYTL